MIEKIVTDLQKIDTYFRSTNESFSEKERLYSRVIKLSEEVGELCEAVLHETDPNQREKGKMIDMDSELADVLIVTLLLAQSREKDIWLEVHAKLQTQLQRFNIQ